VAGYSGRPGGVKAAGQVGPPAGRQALEAVKQLPDRRAARQRGQRPGSTVGQRSTVSNIPWCAVVVRTNSSSSRA
jgi:hypothetical protein